VTLLVLVAIGAAGAAVSAWGLGRGGRLAEVGAAVGWLSLIAVLVLALAMEAPRVDSGQSAAGLAAFNGHLVPNDYLRLVVGLWALDAVLFVFIGWLIGGLEGLRALLPATLAAIVGGTVAFGATDLALGSLAAGAVGLAALAVLLVGRDAVTAGARELRVAIGGAAVLVAVSAAAPATATLVFEAIGPATEGGPSAATATTEAGAMIGLFALAIALVVALRLGSIPFHLRVPRLTDVAPPISLPLLLAWIPVPLGVAGIAIVDQQLAPLALPLEGEQTLIVGIALLTLIGGALAAFISDDLRHATGYLVIADGGLVLLGFAALDPAAWGPTRVWLVALAASKTAVAAWSAVMEDRFQTRAIPDLRGWLRHSPILGAGLTVAAIATYGLPGWVAFEARADLAELSGSGIAWLIALAGVATLPTYVRLLAIGTGPATSRVRGAAPERVRIPRRQETLPVAVEGAAPTEPAAATAAPAAEIALATGPGAASVHGSAGHGSAGRSATALARAGVARTRAEASAIEASVGRRAAAAMRRDRTELLAATVLALAVLSVLTSWGALDIGGAASEAAPIVSGPSTD
jgi:NADH:ubiquinone oxidoreductase subunit 2 (subunit N)